MVLCDRRRTITFAYPCPCLAYSQFMTFKVAKMMTMTSIRMTQARVRVGVRAASVRNQDRNGMEMGIWIGMGMRKAGGAAWRTRRFWVSESVRANRGKEKHESNSQQKWNKAHAQDQLKDDGDNGDDGDVYGDKEGIDQSQDQVQDQGQGQGQGQDVFIKATKLIQNLRLHEEPDAGFAALVCGVMGQHEHIIDKYMDDLQWVFEKKIIRTSQLFSLDYSTYYRDEMGPSLKKKIVVFEGLVDPGMLEDYKIRAICLENEIAEEEAVLEKLEKKDKARVREQEEMRPEIDKDNHKDNEENDQGQAEARRQVQINDTQSRQPMSRSAEQPADGSAFMTTAEYDHVRRIPKKGAKYPRLVNIDPGILSIGSLVLASTKYAPHRICLSRNHIWAEQTLLFQDGAYRPQKWTYLDFQDQNLLKFLKICRKDLMELRRLEMKKLI